ncbi:MAG: tyrosine-type recombinase/integrase [Firmicutes bacterium]|nr:tyrosine-type recombinase/integrase [Bacillota bacterium]
MDYIKEFKDELSKQDMSKNTINNYARTAQDFFSFMKTIIGEEILPKDITEIDIREYRSYLLNVKKQNPGTINNKLSGLIKYCNFLKGIKILGSNPARAVNKIKIQNHQVSPKTLHKNDLYKLRRTFHKENKLRDIAIFELLYNTGVRVSELCNIELDDIAISDQKGTLVIREGKGSKFRTVPLNLNARNAIKAYLEIRPTTANAKLLLGERGSLGREAVFRIIKKYADLAGLEEVSPHTLRHQFCKNLLDSGVDIVTVASLAGHSNINTTAIYTQPTEKEKAQALEKL